MAGSAADSLRAELERAVAAHDHRLGTAEAIWLGAEPTFTDRQSESPEWVREALGPDKVLRAQRLITRLAECHPGAVVLRPLGRQYAGESEPRWCYGLYARRDGGALWTGPKDLLFEGVVTDQDPGVLLRFRERIAKVLREGGWAARPVEPLDAVGGAPLRLVCRADGQEVVCDPRRDPRLACDSIHGRAVAGAGLVDGLATTGSYLVLLHPGSPTGGGNQCWLELPAFATVQHFTTFLDAVSVAAAPAGIQSLGLRGFPPPVDHTVAWTTLTPDPAVLEVNQAPQRELSAFYQANRLLYDLADEVGLSSYRVQYNGAVTDSGGGGQLTFGGTAPELSPFFVSPELLPRLIRYLVRHPSLSYWFATDYLGGSSQSPRPDEGVRESFLELEVALEQLGQRQRATPQELWSTLHHFLADSTGNSHRSELNIEKLNNVHLPGRGCLGLVEFRALAMAQSAEIGTARALLLHGLLLMLRTQDLVPALTHWEGELHDRFALPFFLRRDLREVFSDLSAAGYGLGHAVETLLLKREDRVVTRVPFEGCLFSVEQALEFWPVVGDIASQEGVGSRLVDASTSRLEVLLQAESASAEQLSELEVTVNGYVLPLRVMAEDASVRLLGVRYRSFVPWTGLHPGMPAESNIVLAVRRPEGAAQRVTLHPWRTDGEAYPGLPSSLEEAAQRRADRVVTESIDAHSWGKPRLPPAQAVSPYCLDLRRLA